MLALSRAFGFYYAFDESNRYYRLDTYWIMLLFTEAPLLILANFIFSNWQSLKSIEKNGFLMFIILPVVGIVVQLFVYGISVTTIMDTAAIFMVFISYELEYSDHMIQKERLLLDQTIRAFARTIDMRDRYTGSHSGRVAKYARMLAERMKLGSEKTRRVYQMALLHDVGKIGIDDTILRKPSALTAEEYGVIKTHSAKGGEILANITEMPELAKGARWHHERYDGKGYPDGLKGISIPLEARIIGVADSYDAMTSNRSYRAYLPQTVVRAEIERNAGTQFDPQVAKCMLEIMDEDAEYALHE
ncbi:MAG: HD-GYP domain-containing protein [Oscillibacter sp.]|nr:HD-GYP domain-containing protein [Oscillibacter sp.]